MSGDVTANRAANLFVNDQALHRDENRQASDSRPAFADSGPRTGSRYTERQPPTTVPVKVAPVADLAHHIHAGHRVDQNARHVRPRLPDGAGMERAGVQEEVLHRVQPQVFLA
jgi:hypothetical protein